MSKDWATIIRNLMIDYQVPERKLAAQCGLNRSSLRRFFAREGRLSIEAVESILRVFGYELDAIMVGEPRARIIPAPKKVIVAKPVAIPKSKPPRKVGLIRIASMRKGR